MESGICDDTVLVCLDGNVSLPRPIAVMLYPDLYDVIKDRGEDYLVLFMTELREEEVQSRLSFLLNHSLKVRIYIYCTYIVQYII